MKQPLLRSILLVVASILVNDIALAQRGEFVIHDNGLIYSEQTMERLAYIVDSLNLKYKSCSLDRTYFAVPQAVARRILLKTEKVWEVKKQMDKGISLKSFARQYPKAEIGPPLLVTRSTNRENLIFTAHHAGQDILRNIFLKGDAARAGESWLGNWAYADSYGNEEISALYFTQEFSSPELPVQYGRLVQYVDCMVDTSANIYTVKADEAGWEGKTDESVRKCTDYVEVVLDRPAMTSYEEWEKMSEQERATQDSLRQTWRERREENVRILWTSDEEFRQLLKAALKSAKESGGSTETFEEYVEWCYNKSEALELKRGRMVMGMCSMDTAPRRHAVDIARLSAETVNWDVFLRAHLDIMNDRFHRVADASYAWQHRSTYLRELEELQINVPDLMFGTCLRVDNPSQNHYSGSLQRVGRALSETRQPEWIDNRFLELIADEELDDYNRLLVYYAYTYYCFHQEENEEGFKTRTDVALRLLPDYLQEERD